jgi:hypothetical protein
MKSFIAMLVFMAAVCVIFIRVQPDHAYHRRYKDSVPNIMQVADKPLVVVSKEHLKGDFLRPEYEWRTVFKDSAGDLWDVYGKRHFDHYNLNDTLY